MVWLRQDDYANVRDIIRLHRLVGSSYHIYSLRDPQATELSEVLTTVSASTLSPTPKSESFLAQTFRNRLVEVIDQAQHFAALGPAGGGSSGDAASAFREGLDGTERKRKRWYLAT
jgi:hypothetical protein